MACDSRGFHVTGINVKLSAGAAAITIGGMTSDSYPYDSELLARMKKFPTKDILDIDSSAWLNMVSKVRFAISREESRFTLNGFLLDVNGAVRMVATDGHRLSLIQKGETSESPHVTALIPARGADQLKRIFGKGNHSLEIKRTMCPDVPDHKGVPQPAPQFWIVRSGDTTVSGRILTGNFPDYERVMPHYEGQPARLTAADLLAGIDAIYNVANERNHAIQLAFNCTTLKLFVSSLEGSSASIEIPCDTGACHGVTVGFNADYVRDFAKSLTKDESIYMLCSDAKAEEPENTARNATWEFVPVSDPGYRHVIMAMRD